MYIAPNVGGGYTPMTLYLQLRHRLILSLRMSRLMYIAPNVGGGLPPMRECQLTHLPLTHRYLEQASRVTLYPPQAPAAPRHRRSSH